MRNEWNNSDVATRKPKPIHPDLRLMELADRNPSLGGRELLREIIERGSAPEEIQQLRPTEIRTAMRVLSLDDPDYRTRAEQADWIGRESKLMRDLYERGAVIKDETLIIPAEEHELSNDRKTRFITTLSYALGKIKDVEKAVEFHSLAKKISGEMADERTEIVVFKTYFDRITRNEQGSLIHEAERARVLSQTLSEMRELAAEMERLETRESIESAQAEKLHSEKRGMSFNNFSRKIRLNEEALRFPADLTYESKERLITITIPEIDRRLEDGMSRTMLFGAIDGGANRRIREDGQELTEQEKVKRAKSAVFLKAYIDERLRDPETRALNISADFRRARAEFINAKTLEALGRVAETFLRQNYQQSEELRLHLANPDRHPRPTIIPLNAQQRNLLFNGRSPERHTREMRELRIGYGFSRAERAERTEKLHHQLLEPSRSLKLLMEELETRKTVKAISHFQASLLNQQMSRVARLDPYLIYNRIPPHEKTYLFEITEGRKQALLNAHEVGRQSREHSPQSKRVLGAMPRESQSLREYLANMERIERQLLNNEVRRLKINFVAKADRDGLPITEARSLVPAETAREIRSRARDLAWERIAPAEAFDQNPSQEAIRISDTIAHIQEQLQEKARIAQNARNEFIAEKVRDAEQHFRETSDRSGTGIELTNPENRERFVKSIIANLPPEEAKKLAALDRYAAETREAVYQGFETIDAERHALELGRVQVQTVQTSSFDHSRSVEIRSPDTGALFALSNRFEPQTPTHALATVETRDRLDNFPRDHQFMNLRQGHVESDREWHFDSLRNVFSPERIGGDETPREYAVHLGDREDMERAIDR